MRTRHPRRAARPGAGLLFVAIVSLPAMIIGALLEIAG